MPKAESTDNLLTHKLYTNETDERIFTGLKKTRETDNSPAYLKKILSLSLVAMAVTQTLAEPTGGQVVKGQAQINQTGTQGGTVTTIKQSTPQVSINWQSFNVGEKERVATRSSSSTKQLHRRSNQLICSSLTRWEMPTPAARLCCCPPAYKKTWSGPATRHQATRHQATNHKITHYRAIQLRTTHYPTHHHRKKTMTMKNEPSDIFKNPS